MHHDGRASFCCTRTRYVTCGCMATTLWVVRAWCVCTVRSVEAWSARAKWRASIARFISPPVVVPAPSLTGVHASTPHPPPPPPPRFPVAPAPVHPSSRSRSLAVGVVEKLCASLALAEPDWEGRHAEARTKSSAAHAAARSEVGEWKVNEMNRIDTESEETLKTFMKDAVEQFAD